MSSLFFRVSDIFLHSSCDFPLFCWVSVLKKSYVCKNYCVLIYFSLLFFPSGFHQKTFSSVAVNTTFLLYSKCSFFKKKASLVFTPAFLKFYVEIRKKPMHSSAPKHWSGRDFLQG